MDKQSLILIIFIVTTVIITGILVTGLIPQIFKTGQDVAQTQQTLNQTKLFLMEQQARDNQTKHEDQARLNQTVFQMHHEDEARDKQRYLIINETNNSMQRMEERLIEYIKDSGIMYAQGAAERQSILENIQDVITKLDTDTKQNYQILLGLKNTTREHEKVAQDHDKIQTNIQNMTSKIHNLTDQILNLTKTDYTGALGHRELTERHHEEMIRLLNNNTK